METHIFNLKFAIKDLLRDSKKCEKAEQLEKRKAKKYLQIGNIELAKIHVENSIRQKNQSINYLKLSARVDAVLNRFQTALTTKKLTKSMVGVLKAIEVSIKGMNLEKMSKTMEKFERQFENLDVHSTYLDNTMAITTTTTIPQDQVENLLKQIADENNLELNMELPSQITSDGGIISLNTSIQESKENKALTTRLSKLRDRE